MAPSWMKDILHTRGNSVYIDGKSASSHIAASTSILSSMPPAATAAPYAGLASSTVTTTITASPARKPAPGASAMPLTKQTPTKTPSKAATKTPSKTLPKLDTAFTPQSADRCISAFDPPSPTGKSADSGFSKMKYGLWPRVKRGFKSPSQEVLAPIDRSQSSLSESAISRVSPSPPERSGSTAGMNAMHSSNSRGGTLSQRRKVSVPELRRKPAPENFKNAAALVESPTLGGFPSNFEDEAPVVPTVARPKLRTVASDIGTHSRSISCPDDSVRRAITDQDIFQIHSQPRSSSLRQPTWLTPMPGSELMTFNPTRPLSPIFSPLEANTPTSVIAPADFSEQRPVTPAAPKSSPKEEFTVNVTPTPVSIPTRKPVRTSPATSPIGHPLQSGPRISPTRNSDREKLSPTRRPTSPKLSICIPKVIPEEHFPLQPASAFVSPTSAKTYATPSPAMLDRGRTVVRSKSTKSLREENTDYATLPTGLLPADATIVMPLSERETLRKQASSQAERFEILGATHVGSLSKELRALDERCDYLRKTYKSLRAGRQKLHSRVLNYLKSDASFSKDRLLKQEEALVELDRAIDDWAFKLERAENRRLRVRQKLLEHVAASMMLQLGGASAGGDAEVLSNTGYTTPPRSGGGQQPQQSPAHLLQATPVTPEPLRVVDRKDIESIKIYADTQVLNLFSDIELAIGRMCETTC